MIAWRLIAAAFAHAPLSTEGARRFGGRWHSPGAGVLYTASAEALASLERFVHLGIELKDAPHLMLTLEFPDDAPTESVDVSGLPRNWQAVPVPAAVQAIGDEWLRRGSALVLSVPSALSSSDRNLLLNASHPRFSAVRVREQRRFVFDPRMWKGGGHPARGKTPRLRR